MNSTPFEPYDAALFEALAAVEPESFWFQARNRLVVSTVRRHFPDALSLLELGCGTGIVLEALRSAFPDWRLVGSELYEEDPPWLGRASLESNSCRRTLGRCPSGRSST